MSVKARHGATSGNFPVPPENWEGTGRSERLRQAVDSVGGLQEVSRRTGIPDSTLSHNIQAGDPKLSKAAVIAQACGVSLDWLATGRGEMQPGAPAPQDAARPRHLEMFGSVDMDRMGSAMEITARAFSARGINPSWRRVAQVAMLIYDALGDPEGQPEELATALSAAGAEAKSL